MSTLKQFPHSVSSIDSFAHFWCIGLSALTGPYWTGQVSILKSATAENGNVQLHDVKSFEVSSGVTAATWLGKDNGLIAVGQDNALVEVWSTSVANDEPSFVSTTLTAHEDVVSRIRQSPTDAGFVSAGWDSKIKRWDLGGDAATSAVLDGHHDRVTDICYSSDGRSLVSASYDKTIKIWDFSSPASVFTASHTLPVRSVAWNSQLSVVAVGLEDGGVQLFDVRFADKQYTLEHVLDSPRAMPITSLVWQGSSLLVGAHDRSATRYTLEMGNLTQVSSYQHRDFCTSVCFGNGIFASGSVDKSVALHKMS